MDNNLSQTLLQSSENSMPSSSYFSDNSDGSFFDTLKNINITTWLLIILILAFLGFNIFAYLAKGTQDITDIFAPLMKKLFGTTIAVTGQAVDVSAEGAKAVVSETAGAIETGLTAVQDIVPNRPPSSVGGHPIGQQKTDTLQQTTLNKSLNSSAQGGNQDYEAHEASSSLGGISGKSGWCYIGNDRGFRTCAQIGVDDTCMSGEIFPSQEICMNPNLRA